MNPHNRPGDVSDNVHRITNYIAAVAGVCTLYVSFSSMYSLLKEPPLSDRLCSILFPSIFLSFLGAVLTKAVLVAIARLIHHAAEKDFNKYHKKP